MSLNSIQKRELRKLSQLFEFQPLYYWTGLLFPRVAVYGNMEIFIYPNEQGGHNEPHLHIKYQNFEASFSILTGEIIVGKLKGKKQRIIKEWILENNEWLSQKWNEISNGIKIKVTAGATTERSDTE